MISIRTGKFMAAAMIGLTLAAGCGKKDDTAATDSTTPAAAPMAAPPGPAAPGGPGGTMMNKPSTNPNGAPGDALITAKVKSALIADTHVGATTINVDTKSGVVVLRGSVKTAAAKAAANADARKMQGVTKVIDQLAVKP